MKALICSFISFKGHIETEDGFGIVVKLELEEIFPMKEKKNPHVSI